MSKLCDSYKFVVAIRDVLDDMINLFKEGKDNA